MDDLNNIIRHKIGILFNFSPNWMGGVVYLLNLIKTLNFLDDEDKPEIIIFYRSDLRKYVDEINYPFIETVEWRFPSVYTGYLQSLLFRKNMFVNEILKQYHLDSLYPLQDYPVKTKSNTRLISWYADLQHEYYPEFWSKRKVFERTIRIRLILRNSDDLIVSSQAVADDFNMFFCIRKGLKIRIFHFASVIDCTSVLDIIEVRKKYSIPEKYFIISNQFHKHKNHKILLKALIILKEKGLYAHLAMSGRFPDALHSAYMEELHSIINENNLNSQISFLGVIPRDEQLLLMKHAQAVLQPSLFEGWSTVIEDAISLQVPVVASKLPVNIEQLGTEGIYFDPHNPEELATILHDFPERNLNDIFYDDYSKRIKKTAYELMNILS